MKLDPEIKLEIFEKVGIYSNRFSIPEPKVLLTTREVLDMPKEMTEGRRTSDYKSLDNTIVHELIHMRFPYLSHGKRFNKLVRQGLRGKTFPPYKKRK